MQAKFIEAYEREIVLKNLNEKVLSTLNDYSINNNGVFILFLINILICELIEKLFYFYSLI